MSNEKINTVVEEEVLENVEFTEHTEDTATGNKPKAEEVKENKLVQLKNKALGFIGKHKFALGVITGVAGVVAADRVISAYKEDLRRDIKGDIVDAEFEEIDEPTVNVEEIDYPQEDVTYVETNDSQEEVEDAVEE